MPSAAWLVPRVLGAAWVDTGLYLMPIAAAAALTAPMLPLWNVLVARRHFSLAARHMLLMIASEASALGLLTPWLGSCTAVAIPFVCLGPLLLLQCRCKLDGIADWPMRNTLLAGSATAAFCLAMRQFF